MNESEWRVTVNACRYSTFVTVSNLMQHFSQVGLTWAHVTNSY